jgi:hypothetical protein
MATGFYLLDNKQATPQCGKTRRNGAKASGTIILHDAEGGTDLVAADTGAENVANYIRTRSSYGSYHRLVDRDTRIKMAPIDYETWHSVPDNPWSVGICVAWTKADLPRMTYAQRKSYYVPFAREVLDVRAEFARRGITVPIGRFLTSAETQARKPGISTHSRTDPSRRSDPFGTGSKYEAEFLAVLADLASNKTTIQQEEPMTLNTTQAKQLSNVNHFVTAKIIEDFDGFQTVEDALRRLLILARRSLSQNVEAAVVEGIKAYAASTPGVDEAAITEGVVGAVRKSLAAIEDTEYVLTRKEG